MGQDVENVEVLEVTSILELIEKKKHIVVILTLLFAALGFIYSYFIDAPIYEAETTLIVNSSKGTVDPGGGGNINSDIINVNQMMAVTYGNIVKSRAVLETVISELGLNMSYEELLKMIVSEAVEDTEIVKISVKAESRNDAIVIADKITEVFREEVVRILKVNNVEVIDSAEASENPVNLNPIVFSVISGILGFAIGIMVALIVDYKDKTIKTVEDIERKIGIPVVGSIPDFGKIKED